MMTMLQKSKYDINIVQGDANEYDVKSVSGSQLALTSPEYFYSDQRGSGGTLYFNPNSSKGGINTIGSRTRPPYVGLAHELGHALSGILGVKNNAMISYGSESFKKDEHFASHIENIVRAQKNEPLRKYYARTRNNQGVHKLIDGTKSIYFNNYEYK